MNGLDNLERAIPLLEQLDAPLLYVEGAVAPLHYQRQEYLEHARPTLDLDCVAKVVWHQVLFRLKGVSI